MIQCLITNLDIKHSFYLIIETRHAEITPNHIIYPLKSFLS